MKNFLPVCKKDMEERGWDQLDFLYIIGEAYIDHSSFGHAIISRLLEKHGFRVGIISLPDWKSDEDFLTLGRPRLGVLVSAGNIDSMVNHYTVNKKRRSDDVYAPENKSGQRPDRATIVYCNRIREAFGDIPILIGGVEASLRRFAHYDYWSDDVRRSILFDSRANILMYGMGEHQIVEICTRLNNGEKVSDIKNVNGTCYISDTSEIPDSIIIPSFEECVESKRKYAEACVTEYYEQNPYNGKTLLQQHGNKFLVQNPPSIPLDTNELDMVYSLPYMRTYHPMYEKYGGIKAIEEIKFSISANRGCYGSCNFCALAFHQGRIVTSRSVGSIVNEARRMTHDPDFKGYIHDIGGPTANFTSLACEKQKKLGACKERQCMFPKTCKNMTVNHDKYLTMLREVRNLSGVKKVFVRSGIRFDYLMNDTDDTFFKELCEYHISGQLRVAPEHISDNVLKLMGKPRNEVFDRFSKKFYRLNEKLGKNQYLVPYLMSSHPGSTLKDAIALAEYLRDNNINPDQVQDFYPTPGTISTCMYYTELNPFTMEKIFVAKQYKDKALQRALLQFKNPKNYDLIFEALTKCQRTDLIGFGEKCLIKPKKQEFTRRNNNGKVIKGQRGISKDKGRTERTGSKAKKRGH